MHYATAAKYHADNVSFQRRAKAGQFEPWGSKAQGPRPKAEGRNPKETRRPKAERVPVASWETHPPRGVPGIRVSAFDLLSALGPRSSEFQCYLTPATRTVEPVTLPATNPGSASGLQVNSVDFAYNGSPALVDIELSVAEGEFVCLLGPSGCGKTTLLRLLAGLETPAAGRLFWKGNPITGPGLERGVVFQDYSLFPWMNLAANISFALAKSHPEMDKRWRRDLAEEFLGLVGLGGAEAKYPFELSGGMQQRGAIARSLALGSPVLLMDEPFGALDPVNRAKLQDLLLSVAFSPQTPKTVVFVTHDIDEALYLSDRVVMLGSSPGRVIQDLPVPFPRPRQRAVLTGSSEFLALRERIAERFRQDIIEQIEAESLVADNAAGI